jgi:predicted nucleic acid-binding protein
MLVVSDTSPLRALHSLKLIRLLAELFDDVVIPPAVAIELTRPKSGLTPITLDELGSVRVVAPTNPAAVNLLRADLDPGESEAIALAQELQADAILIDERAGRAIATAKGMTVIGVIGILRQAKAQGLIPAIRPLLDLLRSDLRFNISDSLYDLTCREAGETVR